MIVDISALGTTGYRAADWLRAHHGVNLHVSDHRRMSAQLTHADNEDTTRALVTARTDLVDHAGDLRPAAPVDIPGPEELTLEQVVMPRDAFFGESEQTPIAEAEGRVTAEMLNTLLTALYVKIDDELGGPRWTGRPPVLTDSELVCVAVAQALLGFTSEAHWLRYARKHLAGMSPYLPQQSGYNKRLRAALGLVKRVIRMLAKSSDFWLDDCWIADYTPVPCGMSRPTVKRSDLAGWAGYGYCASHSRFYWGLKLYLVCTPAGMPILWALANP